MVANQMRGPARNEEERPLPAFKGISNFGRKKTLNITNTPTLKP
jgi:hypothetical protein